MTDRPIDLFNDVAGPDAESETTGTDGAAGGEGGGRRGALVHRPLERYPWTRLSDQEPDPENVELRLLLDAAGEEGRAFTVRPRNRDRIPGPFEADLYVALCELYNEQVPRARRGELRTVKTSYAELARLMGREKGGSTYRMIDQGLERLRDVEIRAVQTWRTGTVAAQETTFGIIASVTRQYGRGATGKNRGGAAPGAGGGTTGKNGDGRPISPGRGTTGKNGDESAFALEMEEGDTPGGGTTGKNDPPVVGLVVKWDPDFAAAIGERQSRILDAARYFSLSTPTAKRLFRYLDQRRWRGRECLPELLLGFYELVKRLPIERSSPSLVRRTLDPAHAALLEDGFLARAEYVETRVPGKKRPEWSVRYVFGQAQPEAPAAPRRSVAAARGRPAEASPEMPAIEAPDETMVAKLNAIARWLGTFDHYTVPEDLCQRLSRAELEACMAATQADPAYAGSTPGQRLALLHVHAGAAVGQGRDG